MKAWLIIFLSMLKAPQTHLFPHSHAEVKMDDTTLPAGSLCSPDAGIRTLSSALVNPCNTAGNDRVQQPFCSSCSNGGYPTGALTHLGPFILFGVGQRCRNFGFSKSHKLTQTLNLLQLSVIHLPAVSSPVDWELISLSWLQTLLIPLKYKKFDRFIFLLSISTSKSAHPYGRNEQNWSSASIRLGFVFVSALGEQQRCYAGAAALHRL